LILNFDTGFNTGFNPEFDPGFDIIDFQKLSCSKILKILGRWFGRNPFLKGFLPRSLLLSCNYLPGDL